MDHRSREYEEQRVNDTVSFAAHRAETTRTDLKMLEESIQDMTAHYNSDNTELYSKLVVSVDMRDGLRSMLGRCERAVSSPYFGRVDFAENGKVNRELYIGRGGLYNDEKNVPVVIDWRTPIANLYYDAELGKASYKSMGETYTGEMRLKRTYSISDGKLNEFYDSDLVTNDELLQEYLAKNADAVLKDIVATIQKDQNEIIRIEPWKDVIVQGVAGSGKTTVAMHRLAYLIFNSEKEIKPEQYVIIGTNRMFLNYVSGMLPDLGVESVTQMVMPELFSAYLNYKEIPAPVNPNSAKIRSTAGFFTGLKKYLDDYEHSMLMHELTLGGRILMATDEISSRILGGVKKPLLSKALLMNEWLAERVKRVKPVIENELDMEYSNELERCRTGELEESVSASDIIDEKFAALKALEKEAKALKNIYVKKINSLSEQRLYAAYLGKYGLRSAGQKDVYDLAAMAYIESRLRPHQTTYRQIIVDEAQDFGPMIYQCLTEVFQNAKFTVMGDISQNIGDGVGINDWDEILDTAFAERKNSFCVLSKSYRNTVEIAETANRVIAALDQKTYKAEPVVRHGRPVETSLFDSDDELRNAALIEAKAWREGSLALICPDAQSAEKLHKLIPQASLITSGEETEYSGGFTVFDAASVKGLEFDRVVVCSAGDKAYPKSPRSIRLLYVVLTRALHELRIMSVKGDGGLLEA